MLFGITYEFRGPEFSWSGGHETRSRVWENDEGRGNGWKMRPEGPSCGLRHQHDRSNFQTTVQLPGEFTSTGKVRFHTGSVDMRHSHAALQSLAPPVRYLTNLQNQQNLCQPSVAPALACALPASRGQRAARSRDFRPCCACLTRGLCCFNGSRTPDTNAPRLMESQMLGSVFGSASNAEFLYF